VTVRARVIGIGRASAGDDGVGLAVVDALRAAAIGPGVELHSVAEPTALIPLLDGATRVVLVDAVVGAGQAGEVLALSADDLDDAAPRLFSTHGVSVAQALALARALAPGSATDVRIVAVCIARPAGPAHGLSAEIAAAVPRAAAAVLARIEEV
jgi:hydrogenase maturation protease